MSHHSGPIQVPQIQSWTNLVMLGYVQGQNGAVILTAFLCLPSKLDMWSSIRVHMADLAVIPYF